MTLVRLSLEYASSVWYPHTRIDVDYLNKIQCRAARFVKGYTCYRRADTDITTREIYGRDRVHNSYMRCSIFIMIWWLFYVSTFKSALVYVASFIMLFLIFNVPSDTFQSALSYDAMLNIHYAKLVLLCVYILKCIVQYRYFSYAMLNNLCAMSSTGLLLHIKCNV